MVKAVEEAFEKLSAAYIADGHHRAASAVKAGLKRRKENPDYTGKEPFNYFLSVLFPDDELMILPYNRVVKDLNGLEKEGFLKKAEEKFEIHLLGKEAFAPDQKGTFGMYLEGEWYGLKIRPEYESEDPVAGWMYPFFRISF